ncbi:MAG: PQQ-binding-like beta-propeller repeat protein [Planctomyces sp.]|nr:PQQ-binding-like beta-propeller repeat protein [Planctomyces sp.]
MNWKSKSLWLLIGSLTLSGCSDSTSEPKRSDNQPSANREESPKNSDSDRTFPRRGPRTVAVATLDASPADRARVPKLPGDESEDAQSDIIKLNWAMLGGSGTRNAVNPTTNLKLDFETGQGDTPGRGILWKSRLGSVTYTSPVISSGCVLVGTNNGGEYSPKHSGDRGVLLCFDTDQGNLRWQLTRMKLESGAANDWPEQGICSTPAVHEDRVYVVTNRCELMCLDLDGFHDGENDGPEQSETDSEVFDADIIWSVDMISDLGVYPHNLATSSPVVSGDLVLINTSNGIGEDHETVPAPDAPSFLAVNRLTGQIAWSSNIPSKASKAPSPFNRLLHGQWSSPAIGVVKGKIQAFFTGGDGVLYGFDLQTGELVWWFDLNPPDIAPRDRSEVVATPVFVDDSVVIATGQDPEHGDGVGFVYRVDATRTGNISPLIPDQNGGWQPNPRNGQQWRFGGIDVDGSITGEKEGYIFRRTISSAVVSQGLVFIPNTSGFLHCLDFHTGQQYWQHDCFASIWGSPLLVDRRVLIADENGTLSVFNASSTLEKTAEFTFPSAVSGTPAIASGVMFVADRSTLYAIPVR